MIQLLFVFSDFGFLALRLALGAILLAHGIPKLKDMGKTTEGFASMGFKPARFWAMLAGIAEVVCGLLFVLGLFTQIAAFVIAVQFIVILVKVRRFKKFTGGYEFDLLILAGALVLLTVGSGAFGLDGFFNIILH